MVVSLRPMTGPEVSQFLVASRTAYVAERVASGEDPAAAAAVVDGRPGELWVWDIVIDEATRGRGVGRPTMLLAEREASARGWA